MHGLRSGKTLKVLRGHSSYVNHVTFTADQQHVLSASSDGSVKLWDLATSSCVRTLQPARAAASFAEIQVVSAERLVQNPEWLLVVARLDRAFVMTMQGGLVFTLHAESEKVQFVAGCQSPHVGESGRSERLGKYLYCVGDDGNRYCFSSGDGELVEKRPIADHELLGMVHYPNSNAMLVYSQKGEIASWRT